MKSPGSALSSEKQAQTHVLFPIEGFSGYGVCLLVVAKGAKPRQKWGQAQQQLTGALEVVKGSSGVCTVLRCAVKDQKAGVLTTFACVCVFVSVWAALVSCWASGAAWEFCRRKTVFPVHLTETFALPIPWAVGTAPPGHPQAAWVSSPGSPGITVRPGVPQPHHCCSKAALQAAPRLEMRTWGSQRDTEQRWSWLRRHQHLCFMCAPSVGRCARREVRAGEGKGGAEAAAAVQQSQHRQFDFTFIT